ncbi:SH3 domain-containing protein [Hyphomicrobium sp.]|uniref:SH3 domain-containing protein n=1 Tax=Hyphomicrobium sp. TaxID=82 RepID=UPI0025BE6B69|nr:SH3 domain-containing protein [Hyphomicrobium sp.]MCC7251783.1 SH3 domain-containing protein [Hyphomicrobium sp.]
MLRPFIVIGFLSGATGALADPVQLADDDLKAAVSGSTVEIDTPLGTTVPMRFGNDGLVSAEAGVLAPVLGSAKDRGRWWVEGEKLCTKWFRWFEAGVRCLTIRQEGARIYWRKVDDGETGTGTLVGWTPKGKDKPAVVAAAAPVSAPPPADEPIPVPVRKPSIAKDKVPVPAETRNAAQETVQELPPTVVARADLGSTSKDSLDDGPTMRFGGAGLLEASARVGLDAKATEPAKADEPRSVPSPVQKPAKEVGQGPAAPAKKASATRHASLETGAPAKRVPATRTLSDKNANGAAAVPSRVTAGPLYRVTGVHRRDVLNVRRGPSETHDSIAAIPPTGRRVQITGQCRADWCPIRYGAITGWVNSFYLAEEGSRQNSASPVYVARP